jgi:hypothetical protein
LLTTDEHDGRPVYRAAAHVWSGMCPCIERTFEKPSGSRTGGKKARVNTGSARYRKFAE